MNKKSISNASTSRIPSHKHTIKAREKQKTVPLIHHASSKITLTDLCPSQKLKVGELIKTLEERRLENEKMAQQYQEICQKCQELENVLSQVNQEIQLREGKERELLEELRRKDEKSREQQKYIEELEDELGQFKEVVMKMYDKQLLDQETQTSFIFQQGKEVATQTKRTKMKCRQIQVQIDSRQTSKSMFYRPHSKSFQKVMKGAANLNESHASRSLHQFLTTQKYTQKKYDSSGFRQKNTPSVNNFEEQAEECFDSLARRWREIKERGEIQSRRKSKQISRFNQMVQEDSDQNVDSQTFESRLQRPAKIQNYDEKYLNRMLKSKNFSANELLKGSNKNFSSKKASSKKSQEVSYIKSPYFNNKSIAPEYSNPKQTHQLSMDQHINFYQSDILDLAQRIKLK